MIWQDNAACLGSDPDLWFPTNGAGANHAIAICHRCPVRLDCYSHAVMNGESEGIWGGVSFNRSTQWRRRSRSAR